MIRTLAALASLLLLASCSGRDDGPTNDAALDPFLAWFADQWRDGDRTVARAQARARGLTLAETGGDVRLAVVLEPVAGVAPSAFAPDTFRECGAELDAVSRSWARAWTPASRLTTLASHALVSRVRAPFPHVPASFGSVASEAVGLTGADDYQDAGWTGDGVSVAVIDGGFEGLTDTIEDDGELPDTTIAVQGGTLVDWSDIELDDPHGTGVAEHVLDMAPGVQLYCVYIADEVDFENAVDFLASEGISIANHSVGWAAQSYYDDTGPITTLVNDSYDDDGVFWSVSSGNHAKGHWRGGWADGGDGLLEFDGDDHQLELDSESYEISIILNWDQYLNPQTDLDLYLYAADGSLVASSELEQGVWASAEAVYVAYDSGQAPYHVEVQYVSGTTTNLDITLMSFYNDLEHYDPASSVVEPADAHGAFTVGAVDQADYDDASPSVRDYSGQGPTTDGRPKPDLVAPDGTQCVTYGESPGTSFSAPTTAGAAALLSEADPGVSAESLAHTLRVLAVDAGDTGTDDVFGAGLLDLQLDPCIDGDGDGYGSGAFANAHCAITDVDCDDTDPDAYPGAPDYWYDGIDSDCDGASDYDADGDGHNCHFHGGEDCDDSDGAVHPDAEDTWYDGVDSDCDGASDYDADGDGHDSDQHDGSDCDDADDAIHPEAEELCDDGLDNDCDGDTDEDCDDPGDDDSGSAADDDTGDDDTGADDDVTGDDDAGADDDDQALDEDGGCACAAAAAPTAPPVCVVLAALLLAVRRSTRR